MTTFNKFLSLAGIAGNLIIAVIIAYDAIESIGQNRHLYSIVFKFSVAAYFGARMIIDIFEYTKKGEIAWKYIAYIVLAVLALVSFIVAFAVSSCFMEGSPWYYLVLGLIFCLLMLSEALKYKQDYKKSKSGKLQ
ncbi:MAG: hypothetical protein Q4G10_08530 [Bacteroidia bacterium]|nr:hypothetical protein [Bacteroidia bacterium]